MCAGLFLDRGDRSSKKGVLKFTRRLQALIRDKVDRARPFALTVLGRQVTVDRITGGCEGSFLIVL